MRVDMVSEHASPLACVGDVDAGGQNVHVAALAAALAGRGVEVVVHTRRDDPRLPVDVALAPGVTVRHVDAGPPRPLPKDDLLPHMPAFAARLEAAWTGAPPDLVHAHFWMSGWAALTAALPLGIPVAQTFHALGVVKQRHQGTDDTSPEQRPGIERMLMARADVVLATCTDEVQELVGQGAAASRIRVVPCGVDLTRFWPEGPTEERTPRRHRVVVVGRLVPRKGVGDALAALAELPDTDLVVAGGPEAAHMGDDPEAARLRGMAEQLGVADRVDWRGRVRREELPALLRSADLVVCAPWYEPFGIVPLEAMGCGVPVVATAVGGLLDTVVDGVTGLQVPPRRPDLLAGAVRGLLGDPRRRAAMGAAATRRARLYSWRRIAAATLGAYEEVLGAVALDDVAVGGVAR